MAVEQSKALASFFGGQARLDIRGQAIREQRESDEKRRKRERTAARKKAQGRFAGSLVGALFALALAPATGGASLTTLGLGAAAGLGSFAGQRIATAKIRNKRVDADTFFVAQDKARERDFKERFNTASLASSALSDAFSVASAANLFGPSSFRQAAFAKTAGPAAIDTAGVIARNKLSTKGLGLGIKSAADRDFFTSLFSKSRVGGPPINQFELQTLLPEIFSAGG